jgi:hypothetical protein
VRRGRSDLAKIPQITPFSCKLWIFHPEVQNIQGTVNFARIPLVQTYTYKIDDVLFSVVGSWHDYIAHRILLYCVLRLITCE